MNQSSLAVTLLLSSGLWMSAVCSAEGTTTRPYRAIAVQLHSWRQLPQYRKCIEEIADAGADTVEIMLNVVQTNGASTRIIWDGPTTPTGEQLGQLIGHAHALKLRVVLMPYVLLAKPRDNDWRGAIKPDSWVEWFADYRAMLVYFAGVAERNHVEVYGVGSELVSSESHLEEWTKTIAAVRGAFHGKLTYSANWDHYASIGFWGNLDYIGMNSYWSLGKDNQVDLQAIAEEWSKVQRHLQAFQKRLGKPIFLHEVAWPSMASAAEAPWDYTRNEQPVDIALQARLYEGFFRSWQGKEWLGGFAVFEWKSDKGGLTDRSYSPKGKPAEAVLREWLKRPWSTVE